MTATRGRTRRADGEATRRRVLDAAVESILEIGYHRSSTNEIARRAGVTWGVLQHQFGTREALLLEVVHAGYDRLGELLATAEVTGTTLEERLASVLDLLTRHYGRPEQLATIQIGLDLVRNPDTSEQTRRAVLAEGERLQQRWHPLFAQALGDCAREPDLVRFAFRTLRNHLVGDVIEQAFVASARDTEHERALLVGSVAATIRSEAAERGLTAP